MGGLKQLMTREYLAALEKISLTVKNKITGGYAGMRRSLAKGNSLEFSDYRDYSPGDDVRNIDWNSYSRFDRLFLKLFSEEKQAAVNIFLDKSKSMDFGSPNKFLYASQVAASIAYVAVKNLDKVNIFAVDEKIVVEKSNIRAKNAFPDVVNFLDGLVAVGGTRMNQSIKSAADSKIHPGATFIITDLYDREGFEDAIKALQSKRNDITLIHILSPEEMEPEVSGPLRLWDAETKETRDLIVTPDVLKRYHGLLEDYIKGLAEFCAGRNVRYLKTSTGSNILKIFTQ